jgi:hypothetical protein
MSLYGPYELLLRGLAGELRPKTLSYISKEAAHEELKQLTGEDFGYDTEKWRAFIRANRDRLGIAPGERI